MLKRTFIASLVTSLIFSAPMARAGSVAGFGGSTEITQLANNIELVQMYLQQAQAYATQLQQWNTQIQQYQNMITNTLNIPNQIWGQITNELSGVANLVKQGQVGRAHDDLRADFGRGSPTVSGHFLPGAWLTGGYLNATLTLPVNTPVAPQVGRKPSGRGRRS